MRVDAVELGLVSADKEGSYSLRDVVNDLRRSCGTMREVSSASSSAGAPAVTSRGSSKCATSQVGSKR